MADNLDMWLATVIKTVFNAVIETVTNTLTRIVTNAVTNFAHARAVRVARALYLCFFCICVLDDILNNSSASPCVLE